LIGTATEASLDNLISGSESKIKALASLLGISFTQAMDKDFLTGFGEDLGSELVDAQEMLRKFREGDLSALSPELLAVYKDLEKRVNSDVARKNVDAILSKGIIGDIQARIDALNDVISTIGDIEDTEAKKALLALNADLKTIQDDVRTGKREELDTLEEQIALIDDMILALEGVAGATELILDLQEQRVNMQKRLNAETGIEAYTTGESGATLSALMAELEQIERDITTGAVRGGTAETVGRQVSILDRIIANLKAQGAGADVIGQFEEQKANLLRGFYGDAGFAARAGTGEAVGLSIPTGGTTNTSNTTNNQLVVNGQTMEADIVGWIMDEISRRYGVNILQGA